MPLRGGVDTNALASAILAPEGTKPTCLAYRLDCSGRLATACVTRWLDFATPFSVDAATSPAPGHKDEGGSAMSSRGAHGRRLLLLAVAGLQPP